MFVRATGRADAGTCASMSDDGRWVSTPGLSWQNPGFRQTGDHPVVCVSWDDAQACQEDRYTNIGFRVARVL